jgi:hypothetical protein
MNHGPGFPRPDVTAAQVEMLIDTFEADATTTGELLDMLRTYADAGGRDWETYERFLDHLARTGKRMVMAGRAAINPDLPEQAGLPLGAKSPDLQGEVHHSMSASTLFAIWAVGEHHLIDVENWSDQLPGIVRAAVGEAPRINEDPNLPLRNKH